MDDRAAGAGDDGREQEAPSPGTTRASPRRQRAAPSDATVADGLPKIDGFDLVREVHRGGQGIVFEAMQRSTRRTVAVKLLLEGSWASASARRRFEREVELLAQLRHPNVVAVFDSGLTADGRHYFVMDFIDGVRLDEHVRRSGLTLEDTLALFAVVCRAVNFAHQRGVIHRDLKPSNVLVDADGTVRVLDFGLAKLADAPVDTLASVVGEVMGTLPYMSPEQAFGSGDVDVRSDVFSLGVMLYELLTGDFPHPVTGAVPDVLRHLAETPPSDPRRKWTPSGVARRRRGRAGQCPIDDDVATILLRALAKEKERRYQTAGDLAGDIERYLAGEPIDARRDSAWYVLRKTLRRHRVPVAAAVAFVGLVLASAVTLGIMYRRQVVLREQGDAERQAKGRALTRAEGLYLSAESGRVLQTNPGTGLLLAIEGARRFPGKVADEALFAAWQVMTEPGHEERTLIGHASQVTWGAFDPDARRVVTASSDGTCRIWDAATGRELHVLAGHEGGATHAEFSPDGTLVLTAAANGALRTWDADGGRLARELPGLARPLVSVTFDPGGRRVLGCEAGVRGSGTERRRGKVMLWSVDDGAPAWTQEGHWSAASFSPDGSIVVTASADGTASAWDAATGQPLATFQGHSKAISDVDFSDDGRLLITSAADNTARTWDVASGAPERTFERHRSYLLLARFTPDARRVLTSAASPDFYLRLFDADSGAQLAESGFELQLGAVTSADFTPDGSRLLTASRIDATPHVRDARTLAGRWPLVGHEAGILHARFSRDGKRVITVSVDGTARTWDGGADGANPNVLAGHAHRVNSAFFDAKGGRILTGSLDRTAKSWDASTRKVLVTFAGHDDMVTFATWSADGKLVATGSTDHTARVWDAETGAELLKIPHSVWVRCVAFSPDGGSLVTGCDDYITRTWDVATGRLLAELKGMTFVVQGVAFSPDGRRIATAGDPSAHLWDAASGREVRTLPGDGEMTMFATFSRDGRLLVSGDRNKTAWVWDVETGEKLATLVGHEAALWWGELSPDGTRVVTGANDKTARLWDTATGRELATLRWHSDALTTVTFSPDGRFMLTASADRTARLWPTDPLAAALAIRPRDLTERERQRYLPDEASASDPEVVAPSAVTERGTAEPRPR